MIHAREAGVAKAFVPVARALEEQEHRLIFDLNSTAARYLGDGPQGNLCDSDLLLCGYDLASKDTVGPLIKKAKKLDIPSLGLLDAWKGLDRFWYGDGRMRPLTDKLVVIDEISAHWLIKHGVPKELIIVIGHPALEMIGLLSDYEKHKIRSDVRMRIGIGDEDKLLLLISELIFPKTNVPFVLIDALTLGVNQITVTAWLEQNFGKDYILVVRKHPLESGSVIERWKEYPNLTEEEILSAVDQVVGLSSTMMTYAVMYGIETINLYTLLFDWRPEDSLIPEDVWNQLIAQGILGQPINHKATVNLPSFSGATQEICRLINELIKE